MVVYLMPNMRKDEQGRHKMRLQTFCKGKVIVFSHLCADCNPTVSSANTSA